jgi:hypothetical protein
MNTQGGYRQEAADYKAGNFHYPTKTSAENRMAACAYVKS